MNSIRTLLLIAFSWISFCPTVYSAGPPSIPSTVPAAACSIGQASAEGPILPKGQLGEEVCNVFPHTECKATNTCDLLEVGFWVKHFTREVKKTHTTEPEAGSMLYTWYETKSLDTLEKYVFVQYVRGCAYFVMDSDEESQAYFNAIEHGGIKNAEFCFPDWEIDMTAHDPVYTSEGSMRHQYAQWTNTPRQFPTKYAKEYGEEKPVYPILGMIDSPDRAFVRTWGNGRVLSYNTALEFRTCLYRAEDVPSAIDAKGKIAASPLRCAAWESKHIYNPVSGRIESPSEMPSICRSRREPYVPFMFHR